QDQAQLENDKQFDEVLEKAKAEFAANEKSLSQDVVNMVTMAHLLGLIGFVGPLVVWLLKKDEHKFINEQVKEILNYQISFMIYFFASCLLCIIRIRIGFLIIPILMVLHIIFIIIASVKASEGKAYRYPIAIRFLK
ncbi:MAG TPA: DUF4870 domain-containing protein, partial [Sedimentisphaerales bacterium]|nr:DUF4870 domain-containing protein [Sedimentisphaerales bacterium]